MEKRIIELTARITAYIEAGGDIYAPKRQLPYYDYMSEIVKSLRKTNPAITYEDVYMLCGIRFDRKFDHFKKFMAKVKKFSVGKNADQIRTSKVRAIDNSYEILKNYADKYNTTPFDFLYLMSGYYFSDCYIKTDYIQNLKEEILEAYPTGDITGIRWERPDLYEKIRNAQKYMPANAKISLLELLGVSHALLSPASAPKINEKELVAKLKELYPDMVIIKLQSNNQTLYNQLIKICQHKQISTSEWASSHGFSYPLAQTHTKLSKTKVDTEKRIHLLNKLKAEALENIKVTGTDEIDLFNASLQATLMVIDKLNAQEVRNYFSQKNDEIDS